MNISELQRDTLFVLYAIYQQGVTTPIPLLKLFSMLNSSRQKEVFINNFRVSCHTLAKNGLLNLYRHPTNLKLAFSLTPEGIKRAEKIHADRLSEKQEN